MKEGRDLVKEAVSDAKSLKEAAVEAAKNELIETLAPSIRTLVEKGLKGKLGAKEEGVNRMRRAVTDNAPGESHSNFEEGKDKGESKMDAADKKVPQELDQELDMESLASFFPQLQELNPVQDGGEEEVDLEAAAMGAGIPTLGEDEEALSVGAEDEVKQEAKKADKEEETVDEEIEISEAELRKVYEAALKTEVEVKKGFSDMTKSGELSELDPAAGIADVKKGEGQWAEAEVPAKQDFTVKEMIQRGLAENKALRAENANLRKMVQALGKSITETNLFNAKVLHVNRILNQGRLTTEQKRVVMESIDKARSISEVKTVSEVIMNSFAAAKSQLAESSVRKPAANAQRVRTSGTPNQKVLSESVDRSNNEGYARLAQLAGLSKLK